jgi:nucleotide-binding universal stress UspA family protein
MSVFEGKILLATDGSPEAERAAGMAVALSKSLGAELHVTYVESMPDPLAWPESRVMVPELREDIRERAEAEARTKLEEEAEKIRGMGGEIAGVHAGTGRPDAEIVRAAEELGAGLVILGSRGLGPVRRAVMGSVSGSVVHHSHGSVLIVRDGAGEDGDLPAGPILLAVDGSGQAKVATEAALEISNATDPGLHVVFVMPTERQLYSHHFYSQELKQSIRDRAEDDVEAFLAERRGWIEDHGGKVEDTHAAVGRPDAEIVKLAEELQAGLIVVGSRGLGGVRRALMGSVSDSVVRHAHSPVLVARGEEGSETYEAQ